MSNRLLMIVPIIFAGTSRADRIQASNSAHRRRPSRFARRLDQRDADSHGAAGFAFAGKLNLTEAEASRVRKAAQEELTSGDGKSDSDFHRRAGSGETGGYNASVYRSRVGAGARGWSEAELADDRSAGWKGSAAHAGSAAAGCEPMRRGALDSAKDRPFSERCLLSFGSSSGPPMLPVLYNNNYQIVQTADSVMILVEMVHDARIIRMNASA